MKDKKKLIKLQKKYDDLLVEHELTKGHFEDFAESTTEQTKALQYKIVLLNNTICRLNFNLYYLIGQKE